MTIDVRATRPDEFRQAADAFTIALMVAPPSDEQWERSAPSWAESHSFSAWDGTTCVGHASQIVVDTTVPGGARLPTAAIGRVGVLPTARRRGVATRLMGALITDAAERGAALTSLRASEATIYGRYGFGIAGHTAGAAIDPIRARPLSGAAGDGSFRILAPDEILPVIEPLYDRVAHRRPGAISRPATWTRRYLAAAIERSAASVVVVHVGNDGVPDGYAHYTVKWTEGMAPGSTGEGEVEDVFGATDAIELALWRFVLDVDLVTRWVAPDRPVDDLLRFAMRDQRAYRVTSIEDEQWLRLVDAAAALRARTYNDVEGSIVVEVADPLIRSNSGSWRISARGAAETSAPADLRIGIATLSALYLGGPSWQQLAAVGAVEATDDSAVRVADALFASRPLPFCGSFF